MFLFNLFRVSIRKFFAKESANICFRCATYLREKIALLAIIRKLHFAQSYAFPLLRYSVLRCCANKFSVKR